MKVLLSLILGIYAIPSLQNSFLQEQKWLDARLSYDLEMMKNSVPSNGNVFLFELIDLETNYLIEGKEYSIQKRAFKQEENPLTVLLYARLQGRNAKRYNKDIHQALLQQLDRFQKEGVTYWENQFHLAIVTYIIPFSPDQIHLYPLIEEHLKTINWGKLSTIDQYRYYQLKADLVAQQLFFNEKTSSTIKDLKKLLEASSKLTVHEPYLKGLVEKKWGIYHEVFTNNYNQALTHFKKVSLYFDSSSFWEAKKGKVLNDHSIGVLLCNEGNYKEALPFFQKGLNAKAIQEHPEGLLNTNEYLSKCYEGMGDPKQALYYFKEARKHLDSLNRLAQTKEILKMSLTHDVEKKQKELEQLNQKHVSIRSQYLTLVPIAGSLMLLVVFFIWLYRKTLFQKRYLETEKIDTLREVKSLKKLVVKNHIVLKDKTKVYINDLLYVKSEDHYIRVYTSDGKSHLARGRLSDLEDQLPPNFVRTHRSYITNRNFVRQIFRSYLLLLDGTEIPISRSFQKQWT